MNWIRIRELIRKEFIQLFRDKKNRPILVVVPFIQLFIFVPNLKFIPEKMVPYYFRAADIITLPYRHFSSQSGVLMQAYHYQRPVIATDVGGIKEQIVDGETGFLISHVDPVEMVKKIIFLIENQEERKNMGRKACRDARIRFDVNRMVGDYLDLYAEIIDDPRYPTNHFQRQN